MSPAPPTPATSSAPNASREPGSAATNTNSIRRGRYRRGNSNRNGPPRPAGGDGGSNPASAGERGTQAAQADSADRGRAGAGAVSNSNAPSSEVTNASASASRGGHDPAWRGARGGARGGERGGERGRGRGGSRGGGERGRGGGERGRGGGEGGRGGWRGGRGGGDGGRGGGEGGRGGGEGGRGGRGTLRRGRGGAPRGLTIVGSQRQFGGHLTSAQDEEGAASLSGLNAEAVEFVPGQQAVPRSSAASVSPRPPPPRGPSRAPQRVDKPPLKQATKSSAADLPTRIHEDIDNGQYECVICTSEVVRSSRVWSCSICWTVAHLHCVKKWHTNQVKSPDQNPEPQQVPTWRCPGCNSSLTEDPGPYHCWCGKEIGPTSVPGLTPHSCGQTCSKPRTTCPHPCSLMCHAGPCPPCMLMGPAQTCFCGKNTTTKRCSETDYGKGWSCQEICGDLLPCGEHTCSRPCHAGLCGSCEIPILSICYCGRGQKEIPCDRRDEIQDSFNHGQLVSQHEQEQDQGQEQWFEGSFRCGRICGRPFDCGYHTCEKTCHAQEEEAAHCPLSPDVVTHCPCGKTALASMTSEDAQRRSCQDPIPRCDKACDKTLPCGHSCPDKCHTGACAPCTQKVDIACRCGRTTSRSACHQGQIEHPVCFRICRAQLNCGRHECGEHCCSGEKKAAERRRRHQQRPLASGGGDNNNNNFEAEHICLQVCGRPLKCGRHTCPQLCHKGACASCPEAIFDEIACSCGRTVLHPPQPCGTRPPECRFDCVRPRPCGHPFVAHQCHTDDAACPKCPFLVEKACICGKRSLKNQPCWFDEARCGLVCGKTLKCGTHKCQKTCHRPGQCEDSGIVGSHCAQPCGKVRKSCEHTCTEPCHAPYPCKEDKPCQSKTFVTCPCQNRKNEVKCQATRANSSPTREELKCDDECLRLQRNRRLAAALDIDPETHSDDHVPYSDATLKLFRETGVNWAQAQEREFRVFAADPSEKRLRFKPMASSQRAFLHALAEDFGLDSESQDPEPHRHVSIFKTPRFVSAPRKTLAQCLRIVKTAAQLGAAVSSAKTAASTSSPSLPPFNALLLTDSRFGLTIDELDAALAPDLAARSSSSSSSSSPGLVFTTSFLPSDEVLITATPTVRTSTGTATTTAALLGTTTPQAVEAALTALKPAVSRTVSRLKLATGVTLCHADTTSRGPGGGVAIVRRERDGTTSTGSGSSGAGGWNAVVSRGGWRRQDAKVESQPETKPPSGFLALRKTVVDAKSNKKKVDVAEQPEVEVEEEKEAGKEAEEEEEVEEDWFVAAEKLEKEEGKEEREGEGRDIEDDQPVEPQTEDVDGKGESESEGKGGAVSMDAIDAAPAEVVA